VITILLQLLSWLHFNTLIRLLSCFAHSRRRCLCLPSTACTHVYCVCRCCFNIFVQFVFAAFHRRVFGGRRMKTVDWCIVVVHIACIVMTEFGMFFSHLLWKICFIRCVVSCCHDDAVTCVMDVLRYVFGYNRC